MTKNYTNGEITIHWDSQKCFHSAICARGLSSVFKPREKPWIQMENSDSKTIAEQVVKCPSGALSLLDNFKW